MTRIIELWASKDKKYFAIKTPRGKDFLYETGMYIVSSEVYVQKIGTVRDKIPNPNNESAENVLQFICDEAVLHFRLKEVLPTPKVTEI